MKLTIIAGLPGSGKTHAAMRIARETGAVRLSRDDVRLKIFPQPTFSEAEKALVFEVLLLLAEYHLRRGQDVILEGMPFSRRRERDAAHRIAIETGAYFQMIQCVCPEEVALERISRSRGRHPAGDRSEDLYFTVRDRFEPIAPEEGALVLHCYEE